MAAKEMYVRAELSKSVDGGVAKMQSWIPEHLGVAGLVINLKDTEDGCLLTGWTVDSATRPAVAFSDINERSRDHKKTRKATDI